MLPPTQGVGFSAGHKLIVPSWMKSDPTNKKVEIDIEGTWNTNHGPFNFNGYGKGELRIVIPVDWKVKVNFSTLDANYPHSAILTKEYPPEQLPDRVDLSGAAIRRAYTNNPESGFLNDKDSFRYFPRPENAGNYLLLCGVGGHARAGMWIYWTISANAEFPHVVIEKKPKKPGRS